MTLYLCDVCGDELPKGWGNFSLISDVRIRKKGRVSVSPSFATDKSGDVFDFTPALCRKCKIDIMKNALARLERKK